VVERSLVLLAISIAVLICAPSSTTAADDLRSMWLAHTNSPEQLAAAINEQFTNGTPMGRVEAALGRKDTMIVTTTLSWPPETQNQRIWVYRFGAKQILISSTGGPMTPMEERGFAGAKVAATDTLTHKPSQVATNGLILVGLWQTATNHFNTADRTNSAESFETVEFFKDSSFRITDVMILDGKCRTNVSYTGTYTVISTNHFTLKAVPSGWQITPPALTVSCSINENELKIPKFIPSVVPEYNKYRRPK